MPRMPRIIKVSRFPNMGVLLLSCITPKEIIKARTTHYCFLEQIHQDLLAEGRFDASSDWVVCSGTMTEKRHNVRPQIQVLGFYLAGFLCLVLAVLKLTIEGHWSWWRVLLPLSVVLGHNALYITVGFVWLFFADDGPAGEEVTIRQDDRPYRYQLAAMLCFLIFADNLLGRIEGPGETMWLWAEIGQMGADLRVWRSQRGVPASVLVWD